MSGFAFNPGGVAGVDAPLRAGLNRYLRTREREINAVQRAELRCIGGPFAGNTIALEHGQTHSATFKVGEWTGRYEVRADLLGHAAHAEWRAT